MNYFKVLAPVVLLASILEYNNLYSQTPSDTLERIYISSDTSSYLYLPPVDEPEGVMLSGTTERTEEVKSPDRTILPLPKEISRVESYLGKGEFHQTSYYIIEGSQPGPTVIVHGGMHGDERASFLACESLLPKIEVVRGKLIIIPRINRPACDQQNRWYNNDASRDFNHYFPGRNLIGSRLMNNYEYNLAREFVSVILDHKPDVILNLHEDKDKFYKIEGVDTVYDDMENLGQTLYTIERPISKEVKEIISNVNKKIPFKEYHFTANSVLDYDSKQRGNLLEYITDEITFDGRKIRSYTLETYRNEDVRGIPAIYQSGFTLDDRIKLQTLIILSLLDTFGLKYRYGNGSETLKELTNLTPVY